MDGEQYSTLSSASQSTNNSDTVWPVHIEVRVKRTATSRFDTIQNTVQQYILTCISHIFLPSTLQGWEEYPLLATSVDQIRACESSCPAKSLPVEQISPQIHVYQPSDTDAFEELASGNGQGDGEEVTAANVRELPNCDWEGLWESLIYSDDIKSKLLDYIYATVVFSDADVDFNVVSWNRVVLLHGPPGTGKTSLCRALAQKLSIRLSDRYPHSRILEINSHSLFSRWFSESGKLVQRLFSTVTDMVEDEDTFVVVLIDEVESLTSARAGAMAGTEPSDALRVVNALLTQLDKLKHRKNVLVMSTSNLAKAIDSAFVDRADIIQYVDLPPRDAIYEILRTCLCELVQKGIVTSVGVPSLAEAQLIELASDASTSSTSRINGQPSSDLPTADGLYSADAREKSKAVAIRLLSLSQKCRSQKMSGRSLRRLPVLAHAQYIGAMVSQPPIKAQMNGKNSGTVDMSRKYVSGTDVSVWLDAMDKVVEGMSMQRSRLHEQ